ALETSAQRALGVVSQSEAEENEHPRKGSVEIGHGRTATGASYTIWAEPSNPNPRPFEQHCPINLDVEEHESELSAGGALVSVSGSSGCLSRTRPQAPSVSCADGLLRI